MSPDKSLATSWSSVGRRAGSSRSRNVMWLTGLFDRDDRAGVLVELVQVLADAVPAAPFVGPPSEAFVDDRPVGPEAGGAGIDPQQIGPQLVAAARLVR